MALDCLVLVLLRRGRRNQAGGFCAWDLVLSNKPAVATQTPRAERRRLAMALRSAARIGLRQDAILRWAGLVGVLLFAFWVGMSPHWGYPYPLHVDEWSQMGYGQAVHEAGSLDYPSPYSRTHITYHPEMGFHILWAWLEAVTGLSWIGLYRVMPGLTLALLAFLTYALGGRTGSGLLASLFVPLIPTSLWTLGPAFVAPVTVATLTIPVMLLALTLSSKDISRESLLVALVLIGGMVFVHPTSAGVATVIAALYVGASLTEAFVSKRYRVGASLLVALGVTLLAPVMVLGFWIPEMAGGVLVQSGWGRQTSPFPSGLQPAFVEALGIETVILGFVGIALYLSHGLIGLRSLVLPLCTFALMAFLSVYPLYFLGPAPLYDRGWSALGLFIVMFAGYAVATYFRLAPAVAATAAAWLRRPVSGLLTGTLWGAGCALVFFVLTTSLFANPARPFFTQYYHLATESNLADYAWIGRHLPENAQLALGESSLGWAYPLAAGPGSRVAFTAAYPFTSSEADKLRAMVASRQADMGWLRAERISVVYTCSQGQRTCPELQGRDIFKVREGVFFVSEATASH